MGFVAISGGFTLDDTVLLDNTVMRAAPGGNILYGAIGARIWHDNVGLLGMIGEDYPEEHLNKLRENGFDLDGLQRVKHPCLKVWALHEGHNERQLIYKLDSGKNQEMDPNPENIDTSYSKRVTALHVAAIPYLSQKQIINKFIEYSPYISLDTINIVGQIDPRCLAEPNKLDGINAFLPSEDEVNKIWEGKDHIQVLKTVCQENAIDMVIKLGNKGCIVFDHHKNAIHSIPVFDVPVIDTTGAGDSFCGGFIAGMDLTADVLTAAMMGTISSSFLIQNFGAMHALNTNKTMAYERLAILKNHIHTISI